jgi:hypothetical protein
MVLSSLNLPIDIPWKRIGVSPGPDIGLGDIHFPQKWKSSIAVYYYEPKELSDDLKDRKITYLKIACTITNYQISGEEELSTWTDFDEMTASYWGAWHYSHNPLGESYPCHGALIQVAVYPPPNGDTMRSAYPYISSFEPRKREMYEAVTESGEVASQSSSRINMGKTDTNQDSSENYDLDMGYSKSASGSASAFFGIASASGSTSESKQGQWGSIDRQQTVNQNVMSADTSREKRESYSHTSTNNQLYTLLQGYHAGTNRVIFFLQPRPHIQDTKFTFVKGPRRLEGTQEFFCVVNRPAEMPGLCTTVTLETAHLKLVPTYLPRIIPLSDLWKGNNLEKTAVALGIDTTVEPYVYEDENVYGIREIVDIWNSYAPFVRQVIATRHTSQESDDKVIAWVNDNTEAWDQFTWNTVAAMQYVVATLPEIGTESIVLIFEEVLQDYGNVFVTSRLLNACFLSPRSPGPGGVLGGGGIIEAPSPGGGANGGNGRSIVFESPVGSVPFSPGDVRELRGDGLNSLTNRVNELLSSSISSSRRIPHGEMSFLETDLA